MLNFIAQIILAAVSVIIIIVLAVRAAEKKIS